MPALITA